VIKKKHSTSLSDRLREGKGWNRPGVTEPPKSLGPPTIVLVQRTLDNPIGAHNHLTSLVFVSFYFPKSVSPVTQILQHNGGTNKRKRITIINLHSLKYRKSIIITLPGHKSA
jgi:hypothetical protein